MGVSPIIKLVNAPVPVPSIVRPSLLLRDGMSNKLQQTPRSVTSAPPSSVTLPPQVAEVAAMLLTALVVTVAVVLPSRTQRTENPLSMVL